MRGAALAVLIGTAASAAGAQPPAGGAPVEADGPGTAPAEQPVPVGPGGVPPEQVPSPEGGPRRVAADEELPAAVGPGGAPPGRRAGVPIFLARPAQFLPRSYLFVGTDVGPSAHRLSHLFTGSPAMHLPLFNNLLEATTSGKRLATAVTFSFLAHLRMSASDSHPVRMPSFQPRLTAQVFRLGDNLDDPRPVRRRAWLAAASLQLGHHSNGQEGCAFRAGVADGAADCAALPLEELDLEAALDRRSGNFSLNHSSYGLHFRHMWLDDAGWAESSVTTGIVLSLVTGFGPGGITRRDRDLYGDGSLRLELEADSRQLLPARWRWGLWRGRCELEQWFGTGRGAAGAVPATALSAELAWMFTSAADLGVFTRLVHGRDFYNAFYIDRVSQWQLGLVWDLGRPLRFDRRRTSPAL
jgi:hypothetical protein